ncbi:hypothetical protein OEZ85_008836 [Tetradesmus obliquus]|uniref:C3H1-type domain-containing protein n=1 Tax=Tetradesmus obliquus TaxID=3088 RepID=A0ABY8TJX8_TETOB|nr:hypothetical protein OEZ85_008836 [Tetradesmus obliquus]
MLQTGRCPRGDACMMAHNAIEFWLHPDRYRTETCKDGDSCCRPVCFFAHNEAEHRITRIHRTDAAGNPFARAKYSMAGSICE